MRRVALILAALAVAGPGASGARAAVGSDDFRTPAALLFSAPGTVADTASFTTQAGEPIAKASHCSREFDVFRTAWWSITGTGQPITISTLQSSFDTVVAVYQTPNVPDPGNRVACNDDEAPPATRTSKATFPSIRGQRYLVQVGSQGSAPRGALDVRATAGRPSNDDRADARLLPTATPVDVSNLGASQEPGEVLDCKGSAYAATMWFRWPVDTIGDAVATAGGAFGDTALAVYAPGSGVPIACATATTPKVAFRTVPGEYLVQVGTKGSDVSGLGTGPIVTRVDFTVDPDVDGDGALRSVDCNDADAAVRPGIVDRPDDGVDQDCSGADAVNLDRDGDGEARPGDCDDGNAAINHGARDVPGNAVDEDCSGSAAPFPRIESVVRAAWLLKPFRLTQLQVLRAVPSAVELRCSGRGCPFKRVKVAVKKAGAERSLMTGKLRRARLKAGARLEVRITLDGHVGFSRRVTVGKPGKQPKILDRCLPVGGGTPVKC